MARKKTAMSHGGMDAQSMLPGGVMPSIPAMKKMRKAPMPMMPNSVYPGAPASGARTRRHG